MTEKSNRRKELANAEVRYLGATTVDDLILQTPEGIGLKPLYSAEFIENLEPIGTLPGIPPFISGPAVHDL